MNQEFDSNASDLVKQKGFDPYEYMSDFKKFKEEFINKEKFYSYKIKKLATKEYEDVLKV